MSIYLKHGDITKEVVDAIVNAANHTLMGGGGVDGAIHAAAGPKLTDECATMGGCKTGEAVITKGYNLPAKYVIHTVGPVYGHEDGRESALLADCYRNSLTLARERGLKIIAFPCISTGAFRFPRDEAAKIAVSIVKEQINDFEKIVFVCFQELDYYVYKGLIK